MDACTGIFKHAGDIFDEDNDSEDSPKDFNMMSQSYNMKHIPHDIFL